MQSWIAVALAFAAAVVGALFARAAKKSGSEPMLITSLVLAVLCVVCIVYAVITLILAGGVK